MALFGSSKKETKTAPARTAAAGVSLAGGLSHVLKMPRITEKATDAQQKGVYVFNIDEHATKRDVIAAVKKIYGVSPRTVRTVAVAAKQVRHARTGRYGRTSGGKKCYVYLKAGDTITIA